MYENKSHRNKKIALAAALAVAILALAGVGYAAHAHVFTGSTESATNNVDTDYVVVTLKATEGGITYTANEKSIHVWANTETNNSGTTYKDIQSDEVRYDITVNGAYEANEITSVTAAVGAFSATGFKLQYKTTGEYADVDGTIDLSGAIGTAGTTDTNLVLYLKVVPTSATLASIPTSISIPAVTFTANGSSSEPA